MSIYNSQFKEQMVRKRMPPSNQSVASISRETGIFAPTLYAWKKPFRSLRIRCAIKVHPTRPLGQQDQAGGGDTNRTHE